MKLTGLTYGQSAAGRHQQTYQYMTMSNMYCIAPTFIAYVHALPIPDDELYE